MRGIETISRDLNAMEAELSDLNDRIDAMDGTDPEIDGLLALQEQLEGEIDRLEDELSEAYDHERDLELASHRYDAYGCW